VLVLCVGYNHLGVSETMKYIKQNFAHVRVGREYVPFTREVFFSLYGTSIGRKASVSRLFKYSWNESGGICVQEEGNKRHLIYQGKEFKGDIVYFVSFLMGMIQAWMLDDPLWEEDSV